MVSAQPRGQTLDLDLGLRVKGRGGGHNVEAKTIPRGRSRGILTSISASGSKPIFWSRPRPECQDRGQVTTTMPRSLLTFWPQCQSRGQEFAYITAILQNNVPVSCPMGFPCGNAHVKFSIGIRDSNRFHVKYLTEFPFHVARAYENSMATPWNPMESS